MPRLLVVSLLVSIASAVARQPGGYTSFSESMLKRGAANLVPAIIHDIMSIQIPAVNKSFFSIDPIHFQDVTIGSYDISVLSGQGVQVKLKDMSNDIAHARLTVDIKLVKCTGHIWASAKGASYTAMNTIVLDKDGKGKLKTVTPPGGFDVGSIEVHHKMDSFFCEAAADILHIVDGVVIDLIKNTLQSHLASIIAKAVDIPADFLLHEIEKPPPALGFGKEKFQLDNSYLDVSYDSHRITHLHKGEFVSTLHPKESSLKPPKLAASGDRDIQLAFSDYLVNTLFDAMFAEHIGETQIKIPFIKTIFDKECPKCPIVIQATFDAPGRQTFKKGTAAVDITGMNLAVGALNNASKVLPMVTLSVNASAGVAFSLTKTAKNYGIKADLSLDFNQQLLISHIGKIDMSDLTRDVKQLITLVLKKLNKDIPALPIPLIAGATLGKPAFVIADRVLLFEADLVMPHIADVAGAPDLVMPTLVV